MKHPTFVLHDESLNTYGFRMLTAGANLEEFRKNPVMLLNHDSYSLPIGRWENIRLEGNRILADAVFDLDDPRGREVERKVREGFIKAASIGAWPPEEVSDDAIHKLNGQQRPTVMKWTVREASICTIGANHNALVFYDRSTEQPIDLTDNVAILRLMDIPKVQPYKKNNNMSLNQLLKLSDSATEQEQQAAVQQLQADNERLRSENETLTKSIDEMNQAKQEAAKAEAVGLVDAAVRDGRITAEGKATYIALFDKDFEAAKSALAAIPHRKAVHARINTGGRVALGDLQGKSWDELDKANLLTQLRDNHPDIYAQKFEERFGCAPQV